jgi:hypothetical protein
MAFKPRIEHNLKRADLNSLKKICETVVRAHRHRLFSPAGMMVISHLMSTHELIKENKLDDRDFWQALEYSTDLSGVSLYVLLAQVMLELVEAGENIEPPALKGDS